jgi:hypothetical protein
MRSYPAVLLLLSLTLPGGATGQSTADSTAIRSAALDYVEGWYEGNADRMTRALHPELVNGTRHGYGKETPGERRQKDVTILDIYGNAASAKAVMADWVDYMQLAKVDGRWVIVNVLWEWKPARAPK